jgi:YjbE family integral membrane protein
MRIVLTIVAVQMLQVPYLKIAGALALIWIGAQLLVDTEEEGEVKQPGTMAAAIRTILIADLVMSIDNVIAVAAAAGGHMGLLIIGLAISIPLVIFGATLLIKLMERFPVIITLGAGLIGWVAGEMLVADGALKGWFTSMGVEYRGEQPYVGGWSLEIIAAVIGFAIVVLVGKWLAARHEAPAAQADAPK